MTLTKARDTQTVEVPTACEVCEDARFVRVTSDPKHPLFGKNVPCVCVKEHRVDDLIRRAEIPDRYWPMTLDTFDSRANVHAFELVSAWNGDENIVLSGQPGRGKTHLAVAALRREIEARGKPGRFVYVPKLLDEIRKRYADSWDGERADEYEGRMARWPLLVLDDLGAERSTPWVLERITLLLEERQDRALVTVVTTNLMSKLAIEEHFGGTVEAQRLASRLGAGRYRWIQTAGEDMRDYQVER